MAYVYDLKYLTDNIYDFLNGYNEDDCSIDIVEGKPYYAYIVTSDMTDIDVAFISDDTSNLVELSEYGYETQAVMVVTGAEDSSDEERDEYIQQLNANGIDIICDEDGDLYSVEDALVLNEPLSEIVNNINLMDDLEITPELAEDIGNWELAGIIKDYVLRIYKDSIYDDFYLNTANHRPIFVLKHEHWRF